MKSLLLALCFSLLAISGGAQVIYNSSGQPRQDGRDRDQRSQSPKQEGFDLQRIIWGGGVSLGFSSGTNSRGVDQSSFLAGLSPILGYAITDRFSAGVGLGYSYSRVSNVFYLPNLQTNVYETHHLNAHFYSPNVWARYLVWNNIFLQAGFEYDIQRYGLWDLDRDINSPTYAQPVRDVITYTSPAILVGPGIRQQLSDRVSLVTQLLFEVLQDENSPYQFQRFPFINVPFDFRVGVNVGF